MLGKFLKNRFFNLSNNSSIKRFFSDIQRSSEYNTLSAESINYFKDFLEPHEIIDDPNDIEQYNWDWGKNYKGKSQLVLKPNSTEKISKIMKYCNQNKLAVVPQGGNTDLVGASVPVFDEIILSLSNLNKVHGFDQENGIVSCGAGVVLEELNKHVNEYNYEIPLDLGAKGSCQIGGNIATNAGGIHFVKYGPLRSAVLGMEVVLADGQILDLSNKVRNDDSVDLKQMFIGSEGSLGVITKADIECRKKDTNFKVLLLRCDSFEKVLQIHNLSKRILGRNLSAIEFFDEPAYWSVVEHVPGMNRPFEVTEDMKNYFVLVELSDTLELDGVEEVYYGALDENGLIDDCVLCESEQQAQDIWKIRESVAVASQHMGNFFIYDFSFDISKWASFLDIIRDRCKDYGVTVGYGHIGDGNLHVNIVYTDESYKQKLYDLLQPFAFEWLKDAGGSISAEHGIGYMKPKYLHYSKRVNVIDKMHGVKRIFDPQGILNPYKVLPGSM